MLRISRFAFPFALSLTLAAATVQLASCSSEDKKTGPEPYDAGPPVLSLEPGEAGIFVNGAQTFVPMLSLPNDPVKKPRNDAGEIPPRDPPKSLGATEVKWESSDTAVAAINDLGRATAMKAGLTTITARMRAAIDGGAPLSATSQLTVKNPGLYESIRVEPATKTIAAGELFTFKAMGKPYDGTAEQDVSSKITQWSTSSPAVATIDAAGKARGLCDGTVKVIAVLAAVQSEPAMLTVTGCLPEGGAGDGGDDGSADSGPSDAADGGG